MSFSFVKNYSRTTHIILQCLVFISLLEVWCMSFFCKQSSAFMIITLVGLNGFKKSLSTYAVWFLKENEGRFTKVTGVKSKNRRACLLPVSWPSADLSCEILPRLWGSRLWGSAGHEPLCLCALPSQVLSPRL